MKHPGIKKSMTAQERMKKEQKNARNLDPNYLEEFKSYDINFTGRTSQLLFNEKTGEIIMDGVVYRPEVLDLGSHYLVTVQDEHSYKISFSEGHIFLDGRVVDFSYTPSVPKLKRRSSSGIQKIEIQSPLPGVIVGIHVKVGDHVNEGDKILTLEAMKMQNELVTEKAGVVEKILVKMNDQTETNQLLAIISPDPKE
ncbi:MAG: acetyl-CoA carboxylase biotin carboxyl carrier protein subunit [Methanobacteriota archaeon]|nr:MAG: acetyl-CoA carboxylase biotin carboxyl carrier protein subunit [Euryarchaeota archaeon]